MSQQFPNGFTTRLDGAALTVLDADGALIMAADLEWLRERLLNGQTCNARERAVAGAAIAHLLLVGEIFRVREAAASRSLGTWQGVVGAAEQECDVGVRVSFAKGLTAGPGVTLANPATQPTTHVDGIPQFNPTAKCSPTLTQCPRCNNPHHRCDR